MNGGFRFAHLSDWHATSLAGGGLDRFRGKRLSGWASWALNRRRYHDPAILDAAIRAPSETSHSPMAHPSSALTQARSTRAASMSLRRTL